MSIDKKIDRILFIICLLEFSFITYLNLTQLIWHGGYDASSYYLKAYQMFKEGSLFCENWTDQTSMYLDSPVPLAALFLKIICWNETIPSVFQIYLSYGLANILISTLLVLSFWKLLGMCGIKCRGKLIAVMLFLCPYLLYPVINANDLGYFALHFSSAGFYSVKTLMLLLVAITILKIVNGFKCRYYILVVFGLMIISGISSGYHMLLLAIAPGIAYIGILFMKKKKLSRPLLKALIFLIINILLLLIGKEIATRYLAFQSREGQITWIGLTDFWNNFFSLIAGNLSLISALPEKSDVIALSKDGVVYVLGCSFAIIFFYIIIKEIAEIFHDKEQLNILVVIGLVNFGCLLLIYSTYGDAVFEVRYLVPCFLAEIVLVAQYFDKEICELNFKKKCSLFVLVLLGIGHIVYSDYHYLTQKNNYRELQQIVKYVDQFNTPVVYLWSDVIPIEQQRNMRTYDLSKTYKIMSEVNRPHAWGDYDDYNEISEYEGETVLITTEEEFDNMPIYVKSNYKFQKKFGIYSIYWSGNNIFDLAVGFEKPRYNVDLPYSTGIQVMNGEFTGDGAFVSNGDRGWVMLGPYAKAVEGKYTFVLNYETLEKNQDIIGGFDIAINGAEEILKYEDMKGEESQVRLDNIYLEEGDLVEYRVNVNEGTRVKIKSVEIFKEELE